MREFVSIAECALYNDVSKASLYKIRYKDKKKKRDDRFVDGKVLINYKRPLEFEISEWYYKALFISGGKEQGLAKELAPLLKMKWQSVYNYLHRFNFKHYKKAKSFLEALKSYCLSSIWCVKSEDGSKEFILDVY